MSPPALSDGRRRQNTRSTNAENEATGKKDEARQPKTGARAPRMRYKGGIARIGARDGRVFETSLDKTYGFRNMAVVRWAKTVPPQLPQAFLQCAVAKVVRFVERATCEAEMVRFVERAACPANNAQRRHPRFRAMKRDTQRNDLSRAAVLRPPAAFNESGHPTGAVLKRLS